MGRYNVYQGKFVCHVCGAEVGTLRMYLDTKLLTWMCRDKHLSQVNLNVRKTKKDYEREG